MCIIIYIILTIEITMVHSEEDAIREFNVKLVKNLPLDNPIFFAMANEAKLFPLGADNEIQAKSTRAEKVTYYIQHVLKPGAKEYLPILLKVMKESEAPNVAKLADDIQTYIKPGLSTIILSHKHVYICKNSYSYITHVYMYVCVATCKK